MTDTSDLLVVGAGPCGLAVAIAATQAGLSCVVLDRRTIVSTIERYPLQMTFFSTPERIEIGGIPFIASHEKPTRADGLIYYRRVAEHFRLDVRPGEDVASVARDSDGARPDSSPAAGGGGPRHHRPAAFGERIDSRAGIRVLPG